MAEKRISFNPDYSPEAPGEYLRWFLDDRGIKIVDFARRTGRPTKTISEIISGKVSITTETALQFERVLGEGAGFWLALEAKHQLAKARCRESELSSGEEARTWANNFPLSEMMKLKFFDKKPKISELADSVLRAFGVSSIPAWHEHWQKRVDLSLFKQQGHHKIDPYAVAVWLRRAEMSADNIETAPYSEAGFREIIPQLKKLALEPWGDVSNILIDECAKVGVAVALVPMVPNTGLRGAAYWATKDKAVIVISDRLKREANVWFSFFHEACHILEHSKKAIFIDQAEKGTGARDIEKEADEFSAETLIPKTVLESFIARFGARPSQSISSSAFRKFAAEHDVAPGLLLVRLQHEKVIPHGTPLAKLKRAVVFSC